MEIHTNIYTSCYSKMLKRHKNEDMDFYVQVSRSLFYPFKGIDGKSIMDMIDLNYGPSFGMYSDSLEEYEREIQGDDYREYLEELKDWLTGKNVYDNLEAEDIAAYDNSIKELEEWRDKIKTLSLDERIEAYEKEYPEQEDKDSLACFGFTKEKLKDIEKWNPAVTLNFYLLCFEDLDKKYTAKDEMKNPDCKEGTFKKCHRTNLARVLNKRYGLNIIEYGENAGQCELF